MNQQTQLEGTTWYQLLQFEFLEITGESISSVPLVIPWLSLIPSSSHQVLSFLIIQNDKSPVISPCFFHEFPHLLGALEHDFDVSPIFGIS